MMRRHSFSGFPMRLRQLTQIVLCAALVLSFLQAGMTAVAAEDNEYAYLEPKYINAEGQLAPIYDTELASFLRKASAEAYDVGEGDSNGGLGLHPVFGNIQLFSVDDYSISISKTGPEGEELHSQLRLTCKFLTAAKQFTVNGEEKNVVLVSFRGSADLVDWVTDALIADNDGFHLGFLGCADLAYETLLNNAYPALGGETFASVLEKAKDPSSGYYILVTGHSLGGAVANIFTCRYLNAITDNPLNTLCYTFAAPKVCSPGVADEYESSNIINIKNTTDQVTHIGYLLTVGVTPGYTISATTTETKDDWFDILMQHSIGVVYKDILRQINAEPTEFYPYLTRCTAAPEELVVTCWSNHFEGDTFVDNYVPPTIADRFFGHEIVIDGGSMGVYQGACLPTIILRDNGSLTCSNHAGNTVAGDVIVESGTLEVGGGKLTVEGDLRMQTRTPDGTYTYGSGHLVMEDAAGHIKVEGDVWFQGGETIYLYQPDMTAGTLEVRGDFYTCSTPEEYHKTVFCPTGEHRVLFSGTKPQTISFSPPGEYDANISYFCHFETTNPHPLVVTDAVAFEHLDDDLTFAGDVTLSSHGDLIVSEDHTIRADNIYLEEVTHPEIYAHLTLDGNVAGGRLDIGEYEGAKGIVTVTGDLIGTDLYFNTSEAPSVIEIQGDYINNNADLVLCDGQMIVRGDFRYQAQLEEGIYTTVNNPFASVYEGAQLQIDGDLYLQGASDESLGFPSDLVCILKGNLYQICDKEDEEFWNYGLRNLVLAGETLQTVDAHCLYFEDITLANTSGEGVVFLYELYGISGVFNAYGRADGTITPYAFPEGWVPDWKDTDEDGLPDCLDPQPMEEEPAAEMPAVLSDGVRTEDSILFLYAAVSPLRLESADVLAGLYCKGQLIAVQPVTLDAETEVIQELHIPLAEALQADSVKIFQIHDSTAHPLWNAALWQAP